MKARKLIIFLVMAFALVLFANQTAFAAMKTVKMTVPSCE